MKYVLLLAHALVHKLPKITLQLAFEVTVLTNKYDMTRLLWAVSRSWLEDMLPGVMTSHDTIAPELQWLWVTKELGEIDEYSRSFASLSQIVSTSAEDDSILSLRRPFRPNDGSVLTRESLKGYDAEKDVILLIAGKRLRLNWATKADTRDITEDIKSARGEAMRKIQYPISKDAWILKHTVRSFDSSKGCEGACLCTGRTSNGSLLHPNKRRLCEYAMQSIVAKLSAPKDSAVKPAAVIGVSAETYLGNAARFKSRIEKEIALVCGEEHKNWTPFKSKLPSKKDLMEMTSLSWRNRNHKEFERQARISGLDKGGEIDDNQDHGASGRKRSRREFEAAARVLDLTSASG